MKKSLSLFIIAFIALITSINANAWTDRNTFGLKGPVEKVEGYAWDLEEFDEEGCCSILEEAECWTHTRDKKGRLIFFDQGIKSYEFTYNSKGQVIKEDIVSGSAGGRVTFKFAYNSKGLQISKTLVHKDGTVILKIPKYTTYTYQKFDKYGNWIKRTAKTGKKSTVETRTITYYE